MVNTIARAFRWREMLESGEYATIREIAATEKINEPFVGRVLRLTVAGARHRRGNPGWTTAGGIAVGRADETVSGGVAGASAGAFRLKR